MDRLTLFYAFLLTHNTTADPDKWREVMMQNAKLLYATADDKGDDQKEEL